MRSSALLLTLFLSVTVGHAQYFVVKTVGKVFADGTLLAPRQEVSATANLRFNSEGAYAHVLSPTRGHFILSARKGRKNAKGEFFAALKEALVPPEEFLAAATRSLPDSATYHFTDQYDLKAFFRDRLVLIDTFRFTFASDLFPLDEAHYFVLRSRQKRKSTTQRLPQQGETVLIPTAEPGKRRRRRRPSEMVVTDLIYRDEVTATDELLSTFLLRKMTETEVAELRQELRLIYDHVDPLTMLEFRKRHLLPYLLHYYGKMPASAFYSLTKSW